MDKKTARRASLIDEIPGIGKEKAELIGTYLILAVLLAMLWVFHQIYCKMLELEEKSPHLQSGEL